MTRGQIDAIDQLTEMIKMLGNGSSTGQSYSGDVTERPVGAIESLSMLLRDMMGHQRAGEAEEALDLNSTLNSVAGDLGVHLDRVAAAIEDQTEAHREMTEYLARAIDSRK